MIVKEELFIFSVVARLFKKVLSTVAWVLLLLLLLLLLLVFSPWAGLDRDQSSVRRLVWLWYAASWASS